MQTVEGDLRHEIDEMQSIESDLKHRIEELEKNETIFLENIENMKTTIKDLGKGKSNCQKQI